MYNKVSVTTTGNAFIYFNESDNSYSHNINISHNAFTTQAGFSATSMITLYNTYDVDLVDNIFADITATYVVYIVDTDAGKGMSGQNTSMDHNTFTNFTGTAAIWINWMSPLPASTTTAKVSISYNTFNNVSGQGIRMGKMNNSDKYASITVNHNSFTKTSSCITFMRVIANAHVKCNYNVFYDVPTTYITVGESTTLDATNNLYLDGENNNIETPEAGKFSGTINHDTTMTKLEDLPA